MRTHSVVQLNELLRAGLFRFGKRQIGTEADHAEPGGGALAAAEAGARFEFAFERGRQGDHGEIGGGIESDGENAQRGELKKNVAELGRDELGNEGEEEQRGFGIECFGENALAEGAPLWC